MDKRRRACQRQRTRYTKEGPLKDSGLPTSRHLVFIALMKPRMRRGLVASTFSSSRHGASNNPRAHTLTKEGECTNAREPNIQKKARLRVQGFMLLGISSFISLLKSRMRRGLVVSILSSSGRGASNNPQACTLMGKRRRAHHCPRTQYTKEGSFKDSGLPASELPGTLTSRLSTK